MQQMNRHRGRGDKAMNAFNWHNSAMWTALSLLFLLLALMVGPAPVLAAGVGEGVGLVLYEVTEDMYLLDKDGKPTGNLANAVARDRKSTRLNSSHSQISYAVFCLKKKNKDASTRFGR